MDTAIIISNVIAAMELNMVTDVLNLQQYGLTCEALFVPRHILNIVYGLANFATEVPVHQSWVHPALLKAYCYRCYKKYVYINCEL